MTEDGMGDLGVGVCNLACTSSHLGVPDENYASNAMKQPDHAQPRPQLLWSSALILQHHTLGGTQFFGVVPTGVLTVALVLLSTASPVSFLLWSFASRLDWLPPPPPESETDSTHVTHSHREHPPTHRSGYRSWSQLMQRTFQIDVEKCSKRRAPQTSCASYRPS